MDFYECLFTYLENTSLYAELKSQIYPMTAPQGTKNPCVVYVPVSCSYDEVLRGESQFVKENVQFNIYDDTFAKARKLSRKLRKIFKDFSGYMVGIEIEATHCVNDLMTEAEAETESADSGYCVVIEFEFDYNSN